MDPGGGSRRKIGRYVLHDEIASGGMASVHIGRLIGPAGFSRTVAIKALHPQFADDPEFVAMFLDEARLAARIRHPNVVSTLDVVALDKQLFLVMDYVQGESLARLLRASVAKGVRIPAPIAACIVVDLLDGLHAAHEATDEHGDPLAIVHRDVSPHNVMVGRDGNALVVDFGIAKAASRVQTTAKGVLKGKFGYMAPEQLTRMHSDRRVDVFAASIVLWEALTGKRLFHAKDPSDTVNRVLHEPITPPSAICGSLPAGVDEVVLKGLSRDRDDRFASASEMARALEAALPPARRAEVGQWVDSMAGEVLALRAKRIAEIESASSDGAPLARPTREAATSPIESLGGQTSVDQAPPYELTSPLGPVPRERRALWLFVAGCAVAAAGVTLLALKRPHATVPTIAQEPVSSTVAAPPPPSSSTDTMPETAPSPLPPPTLASSASPPKPPLRGGARTRTSDCNPPYVVDATGVKRFKPSCL